MGTKVNIILCHKQFNIDFWFGFGIWAIYYLFMALVGQIVTYISFSWIRITLHTEIHPPRLPGIPISEGVGGG